MPELWPSYYSKAKGCHVWDLDGNKYNDIQEFQSLIKEHTGKIAAVVMEPIRNDYPKGGFLKAIREMAIKENIVLIFDEVSSGFRLNCGGAHRKLGVNPDLAVYGKAISNGYPMAAIVGKGNIMQAAQDTFISSTYWTDRVGLVASIATIRKYKELRVERHLDKIGRMVQKGWEIAAQNVGLKIHVSGIYPMSHFEFLYDKPLEAKTLFTQEMLKRGYLAGNAFYASLSHAENIVKDYLEACEDVFGILGKGIKENSIAKLIVGEVCHAGFQRLA